MGITTSKSSALSIFMPLIINGALFLNARFLLRLLALLLPLKVISPFTTMYASLKSYKSDLSIGVLILISLLVIELLVIIIIKELNFLYKKKVFKKIEVQNNICINVFGYENELVYPIFISKQTFEDS